MPEQPLPIPREANDVESAPGLNGHAWIQRGAQLVCQSCTFQHTTAILDKDGIPTTDYMLVGLKPDGTPIFRRVKD